MGQYAGFSKVKLTRPQRSTFDLSHDKRMTTYAGQLTPCLVTECVPSDSFSGSSEALIRLAPLLAPVYDRITMWVHYFFVPNRLIWEDWEEFITGGRLGVGVDPVVAPIPPRVDIGAAIAFSPDRFSKGDLLDYLGVCPLPKLGEVAADYDGLFLDVMPCGAYTLIWEHYYRFRDFIPDSDLFPLPSGTLDETIYVEAVMQSQFRGYSHDYFVSALPFTQRGEEVLIPLDGAVTYLDNSLVVRSSTDVPYAVPSYLGTADGDGSLIAQAGAVGPPPIAGQPQMRIENIDSISNVSTTINDFRSAYALQVWLERNAVGGSRYTESTQAHFGVRPQDSRLQRPEYIGGGMIPVRISEVVATANSQDPDNNVQPTGNMSGHGVAYGNTNKFKYFCTEHGFIIGILSVMTPPSYHQGIPKMFRRRSFLDYPWPTFAKLGEQQVDTAELYADATTLTPDSEGVLPLFGYQSRYADWKFIPNSNSGDFHDTLLFWTATRDFNAAPSLDENFLYYDGGAFDRMFAVFPDPEENIDNIWLYVHNTLFVKRPLPYFGTPNTLGFV